MNEEEKEENEVEEGERGEGSMSGRKEERNVEKEGECQKEGDADLRYISQYTIVRDSEDEEIQIEGEICQRGREDKSKRGGEVREGKARQQGTPEREPAQSSSVGSAIRGREKRPFRLIGKEAKEEEIITAAGKSTKKKKGDAGALIDAVTILASAKNDSEDKRYDLLNRHLVQ